MSRASRTGRTTGRPSRSGTAPSRSKPCNLDPQASDLRACVESQAHLGLEDFERIRIDRLDLPGDGGRKAYVVPVVDTAGDDREEHAVLGVDVAEAAVHSRGARERVPLAQHDLLAAVVVQRKLER